MKSQRFVLSEHTSSLLLILLLF